MNLKKDLGSDRTSKNGRIKKKSSIVIICWFAMNAEYPKKILLICRTVKERIENKENSVIVHFNYFWNVRVFSG
jgi:hypothetical protein